MWWVIPLAATTVLPHSLTATMLHPLCPDSPSPPFLPVWMNMASLNSWLSDLHKFDFLAVLGVFSFEVSYDPSCDCARRGNMSIYTSTRLEVLFHFFLRLY